MKKTSKFVAVLLAALLVVAAVVVLAACDNGTTSEAYGLVHKQGYVGKATATVKEGKLTAASLDEACFPSHVTAEAADGEYTVEVEGKYYYKTVKWAGVTATYDAEKGYLVEGKATLKDYFAAENNARAYFEAAAASKITVVTSAGDKTDIMTAATLLKTKNGYWPEGGRGLGWKANVKATIDYVLQYGFEDAEFTANETTKVWEDKKGNSTGATWTDIADYIKILKLANDRALATEGGTTVTGEAHQSYRGYNYVVKVDVTVKEGKIVAVRIYTEEEAGGPTTSTTWGGNNKIYTAQDAWIAENVIGKTVDTINGWTATLVDKTEEANGSATVGADVPKMSGGTETTARIIIAIQDALSKLPTTAA